MRYREELKEGSREVREQKRVPFTVRSINHSSEIIKWRAEVEARSSIKAITRREKAIAAFLTQQSLPQKPIVVEPKLSIFQRIGRWCFDFFTNIKFET